jgi:hypothetical protein
MIAAACGYGTGCSSNSSNNGTGGTTGTGGKTDGGGTGGVTGTGGAGTGGRADGGTDVPVTNPDAADAGGATFADVFAIISNVTTPTADTAPGCANCHDGINPTPDAGAPTTLPHVMNFRDKDAAYADLVGANSNSIICAAPADAGADAAAGLKRVLAGSTDMSVLVQKLRAGLNMGGTLCGGGPMPRNRFAAADGGTDAGPDAGFVQLTHFAITTAQLQTIVAWVNAGALNN